MKKPRTIMIDGEYWFSARYAAELLGTTTKTIEAMAIRELLRSHDATGDCHVSEGEVTRLRRAPYELKKLKEAAKLPAKAPRGERMPSATIYAGENATPGPSASRIGNPLADQGFKSSK